MDLHGRRNITSNLTLATTPATSIIIATLGKEKEFALPMILALLLASAVIPP
jgi:hypothetical protein